MDNAGINGISPATAKILPWVIAISFFMQMLNTTITNTSLPSIAADLNVSLLSVQSVVIAYVLALAVVMPLSGWMSDRFGIKRVFLMANIVFMTGSLLCALSSSLPTLIISRIIQGCGGAFMMPVGRLAVMRVYPKSQLVGVLSFISIPALLGPLSGPTLGGLLVEYLSWNWIFLINIPVGIFSCLAIAHWMPQLKMSGIGHFDRVGYFMIAIGILCGMLAMESFTDFHLPLIYSIPLTLGALFFILSYVWYAKKASYPIFNLAVFKIRSFSVGILGNICARISGGAMPYMTPLLLQEGLGYSPSQAGYLMIPMAVMSIGAKKMVTSLINRVGFRTFLVANTIMVGASMAMFSNIGIGMPIWRMLLHMSLFSMFNSMQFTAMFTMTLIDLPPQHASGGNSILSVVTQLSMGTGVGIGAAVLGFFEGSTHQISIASFQSTYLVIGGMNILAAIIFLFVPKNTGK